MTPVLSRAQMRAFDQHAIETFQVPGVVLMENAGRGAADVIATILTERGTSRRPWPAEEPTHVPARQHGQRPGLPTVAIRKARVVVVCGAGNNGGDGFVVARHLLGRGASVEVFFVGSSEKLTGDCRINYNAYLRLGGDCHELPEGTLLTPFKAALHQADLVIDALVGTGLDRPIQGLRAEVIAAINRAGHASTGPYRVALDIPSGLDADRGVPLGIAVQADATVTFGHIKLGLLTPVGARFAGVLHVVDLGVPAAPILDRIGHMGEVIEHETIGSYLIPREASTHKYQAGDVLVIAGSKGKLGASLIASRAALRAGAGLVTLCSWPDAVEMLAAQVVEVMMASLDPTRLTGSLDEALARRTAVAIGPGLGLNDHARAVVNHLVLGWDGLKVVDADALTHFAGRAGELRSARGSCILTPHAGELGRLLGVRGSDVEQDRFGAVREAVAQTHSIVVLKGARTLVAAPDGRLFINMAGTPALATAGSGDALTGILVALACSMSPVQAACAGVLIHALAGDRWCARTGSDRGMLASEIAEEVPKVMAALAHGTNPLAFG